MKDNYTRICLNRPGPFIIGCPNMNRKGGFRGWGRVFGQGHCARALGKGTGARALGGLWAPNTKKSLPIFILVWRGLIKT